MPGNPHEDGDYSLHLLDSAWYDTKLQWRDNLATHFDHSHWAPLADETRAYLAALRRLMELLNAAERETEY